MKVYVLTEYVECDNTDIVNLYASKERAIAGMFTHMADRSFSEWTVKWEDNMPHAVRRDVHLEIMEMDVIG